ncbi:hypothetical protein [Moraxella lacunata]
MWRMVIYNHVLITALSSSANRRPKNHLGAFSSFKTQIIFIHQYQ